MEKKNVVKLGAAISVAALLVGAGVTGVLMENTWSATVEGLNGDVAELTSLSLDQVNVINQLNADIKALNEKEAEVVTKYVNQTEIVTEYVNQTEVVTEYVNQIIEVDNGNLDLVMDFMEDNYNESITVDYIVFEMDAKILSENYIQENMIDMLDEEGFFDENKTLDNYRKSEVSIKEIYDVEVVENSRNFEDKDLKLKYNVRIRAKEDNEDREYFRFEVTIPFEDGSMKIEGIKVVEIVSTQN